ncbi:uncharacterized protein LOC130820302 [Amaranthus tricolor]|uniref:uncharacterized protein LOC130820302 n=1 Tax=Amaranthus tricolor TaxID=29722 RepID=UPI00258F66B7|nr:uncharacterized protein LOC130820302 [Amaranthus tricolor]
MSWLYSPYWYKKSASNLDCGALRGDGCFVRVDDCSKNGLQKNSLGRRSSKCYHCHQEPCARLLTIHPVYDCCFDVLSYFDFAMFSYVRRARNTVAHMVARWNTDINSEKVCKPPFPEYLQTLKLAI